MNYGAAIKRYRKQHQLSQEALGKRVGVTQGMIWQLETGYRSPTSRMLERLAQAFDISLVSLISEAERLERESQKEMTP